MEGLLVLVVLAAHATADVVSAHGMSTPPPPTSILVTRKAGILVRPDRHCSRAPRRLRLVDVVTHVDNDDSSDGRRQVGWRKRQTMLEAFLELYWRLGRDTKASQESMQRNAQQTKEQIIDTDTTFIFKMVVSTFDKK